MSQTAGSPYDAERVAALAAQQDPGIPPDVAQRLARQAEAALAEHGPDAPAVARALLAANPDVGATPANAVAAAVVRWVGPDAAGEPG